MLTMLLALAPAFLSAPSSQSSSQTVTRTTKTISITRDPVTRVTIAAGQRVLVVLTNPDSRPWTALKPITKSVVLVSRANGQGKTSRFEYTTSAAARPNLEFRHPSGETRTVKLTIVASNNPKPTPGPKVIAPKASPRGAGLPKLAYSVDDTLANKTFTVPYGETFEIRLPANPSTGYTWRAEPWPTDLVALKSSTYVADSTAPGVVGSGGVQVYRLKAIGRGTGDIDLVYGSASGQTEDPRRFHFVLDVR